jgi:hypothetical protein
MLDALGDTYSMLIAFYLAARLFMGSYYFCLAWVIPMVRAMMLVHVGLTIIPSALWIGSIYVDMPQRLALIWVAIILELTGAMVVVMIVRSSKVLPKPIGEWLDRVFEFFPAINIEHKVERTNAFVTLVFVSPKFSSNISSFLRVNSRVFSNVQQLLKHSTPKYHTASGTFYSRMSHNS